MTTLPRRRFLQLLGFTGAAVVSGMSFLERAPDAVQQAFDELAAQPPSPLLADFLADIGRALGKNGADRLFEGLFLSITNEPGATEQIEQAKAQIAFANALLEVSERAQGEPLPKRGDTYWLIDGRIVPAVKG